MIVEHVPAEMIPIYTLKTDLLSPTTIQAPPNDLETTRLGP